MMLSDFCPDKLDAALASLDLALAGHASARAAFHRVAETKTLAPRLGTDLYANHTIAVQLGANLGIPLIDARPEDGFSWNGSAVSTRTETAVLLHEFAHWLVCPEARRNLPDFGLGAGPETGSISEANAVYCVDQYTKEREEDLASLLGILLECQIGGPAIIAFCEQNWLELVDRPGTASHFVSVFEDLQRRELITGNGTLVRGHYSTQ